MESKLLADIKCPQCGNQQFEVVAESGAKAHVCTVCRRQLSDDDISSVVEKSRDEVIRRVKLTLRK